MKPSVALNDPKNGVAGLRVLGVCPEYVKAGEIIGGESCRFEDEPEVVVEGEVLPVERTA